MAKQLEIITAFMLFVAIFVSRESFIQVKNGLGFGFAQILIILFLCFSILAFYWVFFNVNGKAFAREYNKKQEKMLEKQSLQIGKHLKIGQQIVNHTKKVNPVVVAVCGLMAFWLLSSVFARKPADPVVSSSAPVSSIATSTTSRTFLGRSQTGYELWTDKSCVYVKGITDADLARLNTNVWGFKDAVKKETGSTCVLFE